MSNEGKKNLPASVNHPSNGGDNGGKDLPDISETSPGEVDLVKVARFLQDNRSPILNSLGAIGLAVWTSAGPWGWVLLVFSGVSIFAGVRFGISDTNNLTALKAEKEKLENDIDSLNTIKQESFDNLLAVMFFELGFDLTERISLYINTSTGFIRLGRYAKREDFRNSGRTVSYPVDSGAIGKTWQTGYYAIIGLPDPIRNYREYCAESKELGVTKKIVDSMVMKSRDYIGYQLMDSQGLKPIAVIIFESTQTGDINEAIDTVFDEHERKRLVLNIEAWDSLIADEVN